MRRRRFMVAALLAGGLAAVGCGEEGEPEVPPGAVPAAPDVQPGLGPSVPEPGAVAEPGDTAAGGATVNTAPVTPDEQPQ